MRTGYGRGNTNTGVGQRNLTEVGQRLAEWRRSHRAPSPIPSDVWAEAVAEARKHGVGPVARTLRLDYAALKRRVEAEAGNGAQDGPAAATFIELLSSGGGHIGECALEVESARGARMRVVMKSVPPAGLASLIRDFVG